MIIVLISGSNTKAQSLGYYVSATIGNQTENSAESSWNVLCITQQAHFVICGNPL